MYETELVEKGLAHETVLEATRILSKEFRGGANSAVVATKVHRAVYRILKTDDPYKEIKRRSNEIALRLYPRAEKLVRSSHDPFKTAVICSIAGNVLDFGIPSRLSKPESLEKEFQGIFNEGLSWDDTSRIKKYLGKAREVLLFGDNAGEVVFDKLLIQQLKKYGPRVTYIVRKKPILTDATLEDAKMAGIDKLADELETTNAFAVGVDFKRIGRRLRQKLELADLILCKGMANYESFSDANYSPVAYFLRAKCKPVAESMGVEWDTNVAKLYEH